MRHVRFGELGDSGREKAKAGCNEGEEGARTGKKPAQETQVEHKRKNWSDLETEDAPGRGGGGRKKMGKSRSLRQVKTQKRQ